ncbi:hypothetical protein IEZ26_15445 [Nocardioides cavernae]|uniref:Uncharacterized protein n=1 Tax=Nocardioides cavernae TaxID=1921566 RepID=A0ABR8NEL0_9ACTN|nr:hypothetical protein [Nocardioides cavernae]MBD3926017.1 hypothetical protein [Nocardioides cavernae]MBM7513605.1 hypothetical protein [Nocardioides cavernae]
MRTPIHQHQLTTPVPDSTPPEHRPNTEDTPGTWDHLETRALGRTAVASTTSLDATLAALALRRQEQLLN